MKHRLVQTIGKFCELVSALRELTYRFDISIANTMGSDTTCGKHCVTTYPNLCDLVMQPKIICATVLQTKFRFRGLIRLNLDIL